MMSTNDLRPIRDDSLGLWSLLPIALLLLLAAGLTAPAGAATWYVPDDLPTVQAALDAAAAGDTVLVSPGTYVEATQLSPVDLVQTHLVMKSGVVLMGATGDPGDVILDGDGYGRVLTCADATAGTVIQDLTLAHGNTTMFGPTDGAGARLFSLDNEDCTIAAEPRSWGEVKALYR